MTARRRWAIGSAIVILCASMAIAAIMVRRHNAQRRLAAREAGYAAVVADYANRLKPGLTRAQVEQQLRAEGKEFHHMCCMGASHNAFDTLLLIGEESAPWYCSEHYVYVGFEFFSEGTHRFSEALPSDKLVDVRLYKQLSGCM
jgi:hypothetical protein